jgi:hypothetical protein
MGIGQDLLNVPMGDMIRDMAFAIADGQTRLDEASMRSAEMMGGLKAIIGPDGEVTFDDSRVFFGAEYLTAQQAMLLASSDADLQVAAGAMAVLGKLFEIVDSTGGIAEVNALLGTASTPLLAVANGVDAALFMGFIAKCNQALAKTNDTAKKTKVEGLIRANLVKNKTILSAEIRVPTRLSMLELGFAPVFYQFVDTIIEVKISISISQSSESTVSTTTESKGAQTGFSIRPFRGKASLSRTVSTSQVNATYSSKYSYSAEGSSLLRTKLVPLPAPSILEQRIQAQMEAEAQRRAAKLAAVSTPAS